MYSLYDQVIWGFILSFVREPRIKLVLVLPTLLSPLWHEESLYKKYVQNTKDPASNKFFFCPVDNFYKE